MLQEVSVIMWEKFDERDPPADFVAWGCRIAYFRVRDYRRCASAASVSCSKRGDA